MLSLLFIFSTTKKQREEEKKLNDTNNESRMADRLIANSLGKYLSVFIKNWSKDALSLSFLRGEGVLNNLGKIECIVFVYHLS